MEVYSTNNIRNEVGKMVNGTPFASKYLTYNDLTSAYMHGDSRDDMFKVSSDYSGFLGWSGVGTKDGRINVHWSDVADWLFDSNRQSPGNLLKNMVRT